jgi:hypothetical protein
MSVITTLLIFIFLIVVLAALRTRLVFEISGTSLLIFGTTKPGIWLYTLFFLPGTIIHELSHWIVAEVLQVKTGAITIFPDDNELEGRQRLGSVATESTDPLRGFLIGVAPFLSGMAILAILGKLFQTGWGLYTWWQLALIIYGIVVVGNSMLISKEDRRTWPFILVFVALISIVIWRMDISLSTNSSVLITGILNSLNLILGVTAGLNLVMIGGSYLLRRAAEKLTKKRIISK